jgi:hypothetical protein
MSEKISWKFNIQVIGGPTLVASGDQNLDAYTKSKVVVPAKTAAGDGETEVNLDTTGALILIVKASQYLDRTDPALILQYEVTKANPAGGADITDAAVDFLSPLILIGENAIKMLGDPVVKLKFTNPTSSEITIEMLTAVDVTP